MKIAVFTKKTTFHQGYGGMETQNKALCRGLSEKGHEITVFSPKWELELDEAREDGIKYVFVNCVYRMGPVLGFFGSLQKENWLNRSVEEFKKLHQKEKFDLVLAQSSTGLGIIKNKEQLAVKIISIAHGSILSEYRTFLASARLPQDAILMVKNAGFTIKNFFRRQREFVHGSDRVIAVSRYVKKALVDETFTFEDKIKVIHNGVDESLFASYEDELQRGKDLLYVGQIIKSKGIFEFPTLFKDESFINYRLDIVGGGQDLADLKTLMEKNPKQAEKINLVGKVEYKKLINNYFLNKKYGVFVLPTFRYEGLPMVLIEAMFSGLPIVAYDMGGVGDAVKDQENGFLVEMGDVADLRKKIKQVLEDDSLKEKMGRKSREIAEKYFTQKKMINQYEKVMKEVLS